MTEWNERYVAYARAHDKAPEEMLQHDRGRYPGGVMTGYILWIQENKKWFSASYPGLVAGGHLLDPDSFTAYLEGVADAAQKKIIDSCR